MAGLKSYAQNALSNTELFPEGQFPGTVNNHGRQVMADLAADYRDREWVEWGDGDGAGDGSSDYSCQYLSATQIAIVGGDYTAAYHVGRSFRITGSSSGTSKGTIAASAYEVGDNWTRVTLSFATGSIVSETGLRMWLSLLSADGRALPIAAINGRAIDMDREALTQATLVDYAEQRASPISASGVLAIDLAEGSVQYVQLFEDVTSVTVSGWAPNPKASTVQLIVQQDGTGGWTITGWPAEVQWYGNAAPEITGTTWAVDTVILQSLDAGAHIAGSFSQGAFFSEAIG